MSDILDMLRDVPPRLLMAWGGWLAAGLVLATWHVKASEWEREAARQLAEARTPRTRSGVRRSSARLPTAPPVDAFGELEALLERAPSAGVISRRPGD